jgi:hypothetical protein
VVQLYRNESPIGSAVALSAVERALAEPAVLGEFDFAAGANELFFKLLPGAGVSSIRFSLVRVAFEKTGAP